MSTPPSHLPAHPPTDHQDPRPEPHRDLSHLANAGPAWFGRGTELAWLERRWLPGAPPGARVVALVGPAGIGKTALLRAWLARRCPPGAPGPQGPRQFGWTFRSPIGARGAWTPEDAFLTRALAWCGVDHDPALPPWEKGQRLAAALAQTPTLLLLDGLEALQSPPAPKDAGRPNDATGDAGDDAAEHATTALTPGSAADPESDSASGPAVDADHSPGAAAPPPGRLHAPGVAALLAAWLAAPDSSAAESLIVLTTRWPIADLAPERPHGPLWQLDLAGLDPAAGAALFAHYQQARPGDHAPTPEAERLALSAALQGHPLCLQLHAVQPQPLAAGTAPTAAEVERLLAAYCADLSQQGTDGAAALALLRLLALSEQPVAPATLAALLAAPPIPDLNEALFTSSKALFGVLTRHRPLPTSVLTQALQRLLAAGLVRAGTESGATPPTLDTPLELHPLVQDWCARDLRKRAPAAWQAAHRRLYLHLRDSTAERPDQLGGLLPLYQALGHGGLAGLAQQACDEVYSNRILRGVGEEGLYPVRRLGSLGTDLAALAAFFTDPWETPDPSLAELDQLWVLEQVIARLRALGRLAEALVPLQTAERLHAAREDWKNAAGSAGGRSDLLLTLGQIPAAIAAGQHCVELADRSANPFFRMVARTTLAAALHQHGESEAARDLFSAAEAIQAEREPDYPLLYALRGYQQRDLLLAAAETGAWARLAGGGAAAPADGDRPDDPSLLAACDEVSTRASRTLGWISAQPWPLEIALDHLARGRAALLRAVLCAPTPTLPLVAPAATESAEPLALAADEIAAAVNGLASAADQTRAPLGLLARAWLQALRGETAAAAADLDAAAVIARRSEMHLLLIDIDLYRGRLLGDRAALARARTGIETRGYWRRREELATAVAWLDTTAPA